MPRYIADVKYIASIYPGPLEAVRRNYGPSRESNGPKVQRSTVFRLEPVPREGKPHVIEVVDSFEDVLDIVGSSAEQKRGERPRMIKPVPVESIVADLLNVWTGGLYNVPQGATPGIMEIQPLQSELRQGKTPVPSLSELRQMTEMQTLYFEFLFSEGERYHKQSDWNNITGAMRLAAEWLGYSRVWSNRAIARDSTPCPFCTTMISSSALVCPQCTRVVRAIPPGLAALQSATVGV
ncbi:MAG: hypothetical protein RIR25_614 [Verrucomicrobiota bacterium]|jgi:hypothetical protein